MEERLNFLASGTKPRKNKDVMKDILDELKEEGLYHEFEKKVDGKKEEKGSKKKKKVVESDDESESESEEET